MPLYPRSAANQGACFDSLLFHYFHFRLTFESIKELGSASIKVKKKHKIQKKHQKVFLNKSIFLVFILIYSKFKQS
jgi:hypothetical protein